MDDLLTCFMTLKLLFYTKNTSTITKIILSYKVLLKQFKCHKACQLIIHSSYSKRNRLFLLGYTNSATAPSSCFGMLTTDTKTPPVTETSVTSDLLKTF